jgi:predicted hydrocarbon binding protein
MAYPTDLAPQQLLALPRPSLLALRRALARDLGAGYATLLQEVGMAGGATMHSAFEEWLAGRDADPLAVLTLPAFAAQLASFFAETGWGGLIVTAHGDVVAELASPDWAESDPDAGWDHAGCHCTTGLLADVLTRVAGQPIAVLEVGCRSAGAAHCRWIAGSPAMLTALYERLAAGTAVDEALAALG